MSYKTGTVEMVMVTGSAMLLISIMPKKLRIDYLLSCTTCAGSTKKRPFYLSYARVIQIKDLKSVFGD